MLEIIIDEIQVIAEILIILISII